MTKQIWNELSKINANEYKEKKGKFDYLSWADAWQLLMDKYPDATYEFKTWDYYSGDLKSTRDVQIYADGTAAVECSITIGKMTRSMWLPVLNYNNQPIVKPNSMNINTAKMRCLVKCMAMFGLGIYIFAGEDLPVDEAELGKNHGAGEEKNRVIKKDTSPVSDDEMFKKVTNSLSKASQLAKLENVIRDPRVSKWMDGLKDRDIETYGKVYDNYQLYKKQLENGRRPNNAS